MSDLEVMPGKALQLVPSKTDQDIAADLKERMAEAFRPVLALCDEAKTHGFDVRWQIGKDFAGRIILAELALLKQY